MELLRHVESQRKVNGSTAFQVLLCNVPGGSWGSKSSYRHRHASRDSFDGLYYWGCLFSFLVHWEALRLLVLPETQFVAVSANADVRTVCNYDDESWLVGLWGKLTILQCSESYVNDNCLRHCVKQLYTWTLIIKFRLRSVDIWKRDFKGKLRRLVRYSL